MDQYGNIGSNRKKASSNGLSKQSQNKPTKKIKGHVLKSKIKKIKKLQMDDLPN